MKRGDPYLTRELNKQRARQRRDLRLIPDSFFRQGQCEVIPIDKAPPDAAFVEALVRREIDQVCEANADLLADICSSTEDRRLANFVMNEGSTGWTSYSYSPVMSDAVRSLREAADIRLKGASAATVVPLEQLHQLAVLVALFGWAEQLADDGYEDHRLAEALAAAQEAGHGQR